MHGCVHLLTARQNQGKPVYTLQTKTLDRIRGKGQVSAKAGVQERIDRLKRPVAVRDFYGDHRFKAVA